MCEQTNFEAILSVTSSLASAAGRSPCDSPDGQMTAKSGPEAAPASHSASPAKDSVPQTSGTCGPCSPSSLRSESLQHALASRLRAALDVNGSPEYALTWKEWDMQSGPRICALRASARRTSDSDCSGWPTPDTNAGGDGPSQCRRNGPRLQTIAGWASPTLRDHKGHTITNSMPDGFNASLPNQAGERPAGWPTPDCYEGNTRPSGGGGKTIMDPVAGCATPQVADSNKVTPRSKQDSMVKQLHGATASQSPAATEKRGVLNPDLPRWLMGYPKEWCMAAITAYRCLRQKRA